MVQNHAAFIELLDDGSLACLWFGGTLEGKSDISIYGTTLAPGADRWTPSVQLSNDPDRSEQNPVLTRTGQGRWQLFHTAQPSGNQDECLLRARDISISGGTLTGSAPRIIDLPLGTFVRCRCSAASPAPASAGMAATTPPALPSATTMAPPGI
jgi:predicted neuraminidase